MPANQRLILFILCFLPFATAQAGYSVTVNAAISGHNKKEISGGLEACKKACDSEKSFFCKSFDYDKRSGTCDLSDKTAADVGGLKKNYKGNPYDHYTRTLSSAKKGAQMTDGSAVLRSKYSCTKPTGKLDCSNPLKDRSAMHWKKQFQPACEVHDLCYRAPWRISGTSGWKGQRICDEEFKKNMEAICDTVSGQGVDCFAQKTAFHLTVKDWGATAFNNGQAEAEKLCGQKAKEGTIRFFNSGGYVADFTLTYLKHDRVKAGDNYISIPIPGVKTKRLRLGQWVEFKIPKGSTSISIGAETRTGKKIFSESWGDTPRSECRKVYGTLLSPKWNKVCELFDRGG